MRRNKPSLLESIEEVSEVTLDQDGLQDLTEPSAFTSEQPPRPQHQSRQTRSKLKDSRVSLLLEPIRMAVRMTRVHLQKALLPVQAAGTVTQLTNLMHTR